MPTKRTMPSVERAWFLCEPHPPFSADWTVWPINNPWIVRAMVGNEMVTAASGSDPWDAAYRCMKYVLYRIEGTKIEVPRPVDDEIRAAGADQPGATDAAPVLAAEQGEVGTPGGDRQVDGDQAAAGDGKVPRRKRPRKDAAPEVENRDHPRDVLAIPSLWTWSGPDEQNI